MVRAKKRGCQKCKNVELEDGSKVFLVKMKGPWDKQQVRVVKNLINEVVAFKEAGWTIIRIHIDDDLQIKRLKKTYGKEADQHIQNRKDDSESEMNYMNDELFDLVVNAADDDSVVAQVLDWLQEQPTQRLNSR